MLSKRAKLLAKDKLFEYALRILGGRAFSAGELREKILRRAEEPADVEEVLARLKQYNYLDDRKFAEAYSASRLSNQGFGKARVLRDLRQRRVTSKVAEKAVSNAFEGVDELELIESFLARKYRGKNLPQLLAEPKNLASAYRRLRLAGFSAGNSIRVLKRYAAEAEALESLEDAEPQAPPES